MEIQPQEALSQDQEHEVGQAKTTLKIEKITRRENTIMYAPLLNQNFCCTVTKRLKLK